MNETELVTIGRLHFEVRHTEAKSILTKTSGFIAEAGFTHSLSPARNCTYGCSYCYVPTMKMYGGLKSEDWERWGQFTTFKSNAPALLERQLRSHQRIYCSPLVDPYQPVEESERLMPKILNAIRRRPPHVFVIQTRSPLIERDLQTLIELKGLTTLRVSFSLTTNRDDIRRLYERHCASIEARLATMKRLRDAGIEVRATLAPLLPCDPEALAELAIEATDYDLIGDPFHVRSVKRTGATTRQAAFRISEHHGLTEWLDPEFHRRVIERIRVTAESKGRRFAVGPAGFGWLARDR